MATSTQELTQTDPRYHTTNVRRMLDDLVHHLREDIDKIEEPRAQALFETSAEVLLGLKTAFEHYEQGKERAFRR
jgi:hypothetical protein